ncbi:MAG TPA: hypothetical protein VN873_07735 [Candidatus Angelobacter sp.]|nr:hypothetical protein [Candidatus Angelobacter sp.]
MTETQSSAPAPVSKRRRLLKRILNFLIAAMCVGFMIHEISNLLSRSAKPAGFAQGMLQGALMPGALPNLALGNDVIIYAPNNTGRTYKLGYTLGVNACGAIFFGWFFWRVSKWKKD